MTIEALQASTERNLTYLEKAIERYTHTPDEESGNLVLFYLDEITRLMELRFNLLVRRRVS